MNFNCHQEYIVDHLINIIQDQSIALGMSHEDAEKSAMDLRKMYREQERLRCEQMAKWGYRHAKGYHVNDESVDIKLRILPPFDPHHDEG